MSGARQRDSVLAFRTPPGIGGLGHHAGHVLDALVDLVPDLRVCGPITPARHGVNHAVPPDLLVSSWRRRYTWLRYLTGRYQLEIDRRFGEWLATELSARPFRNGYFFTQIARESLQAARAQGATTVLDNPNGHIRDFAAQLCLESARWTGIPYLGHPSESMVQRVEDEYRLADRIRVSSTWAKRSLMQSGVSESKIVVVPQGIDLRRFIPSQPAAGSGPLKIVFVGSVSLGKGFPYLLQAMSRLGARHFSLEIVGATGDPWSRRLLQRMSAGLDVSHAPDDPCAAYQRGELFVLPTLHDGFGLVVAEAMACGLPVITTDACGASEWIDDSSGWVVPRGNSDALIAALDRALTHRDALPEMGRAARRAIEPLGAESIKLQLQHSVSRMWRCQAARLQTKAS